MKGIGVLALLLVGFCEFSYATIYHVSINGNDATGDGTSSKPWRTIRHALTKVPANQGHTLQISSGTFIESGFLNVPAGVHIEGAGIDVTIIKAASSLYHPQNTYGDRSRYLMNLSNGNNSTRQVIKGFTLDGSGKQVYGGLIVYNRNNVLVESVAVRDMYYCGIRLWKTNDTRMTKVNVKNCSWGSSSYSMGALIIGDIERVEIDNSHIDEGVGYGLKLDGGQKCWNLKFHHNTVTVNPQGTWKTSSGASAPNIAFELWDGDLRNVEIYDNYIDNILSIVTRNVGQSNGTQKVRIYNNTFDHTQRAGGRGYGVELSISDAEVDHNYFLGGTGGVNHWGEGQNGTVQNWKIHHNVFYRVATGYPTGLITAVRGGINNVHIYNNTVEHSGRGSMHLFEADNGGVARNVRIENNLIINNFSEYVYGEVPKILNLKNGARFENCVVRNNFTDRVTVTALSGVSLSNNLSGNPQITASGARPDPYYRPKAGSPLIDKGVAISGMSYAGSAPDIGAFEYGQSQTTPTNQRPQGAISSPSNNSTFAVGTPIEIRANAADPDGSVSKVEFFAGNTKLGEDTSSPYSFQWNNATAGSYDLTVRVTDNQGATTTSAVVKVTIVGTSNQNPTVTITSPATNSEFPAGSTITFRTNATDSDGTIVKVEFFNRSQKIGEVTTSPFTFNWVNPPVGDNRINAKATDDKGATAMSPTIRVVVLEETNEVPIVALSAPGNNSTHTEGTPITLRAMASDKDGSIKKVEFYQGTTKLGEDTTEPYSLSWANARVGSYTITARATDDKDAVGVSAPLSIHVQAPANQPPVVELTSPKNNATVNAGTISLSATATDPDGAVTKVEFFNGTTKLGEDLSSPYTFTWNNVTPGTYRLTARATDNKSATTTSSTVTITVVQPNKAPTVVITRPVNNATFNQGATITIEVNATDSDGAISKVEFFNGNTKLGEDLSSPYSFQWSNVQPGNYTITARATDNKSATTTSQAVSISVAAANKLPVVQLTSPAQNAKFDRGATITLSASASDSDGSITRVEFYNGSTLLGQDTSSPYSFAWTNAPAGTHTLTAKAIDNRSGVTTSNAVTITVVNPNKAPVVKITKPGNNSVFTAGQTISIEATATDSDGQIAKVEFFNGNTRLGEDASSPYTLDWSNAQPGKYTITARATDNKGATANASVNIEVKEQDFEPVARAGEDIALELPENTVTLKGRGESGNGDIVDYTWVQLDGPTTAEIQPGNDGQAVVTNLAEGVYRFQLTVVDSKGKKAVDIITVRVYPQPITSVELPRIFSPNGDGINDYWEWSNTELFRGSHLVIFNRQGQKIYETTSYDNSWDGTVNGTPLQEDAYYYVITSAQGEVKNGAVRIVR
jgi:gliding motility-associated-like protein|nr:MAG: hypothetical protein DIU61_03220 [Bacteroidota bacterium]